MNSVEQSQLWPVLHDRCESIADRWCTAIAENGFAPHHAAQVRQRLVELTEQVIALLLTEPFDHGRAQAIGASLAELHYYIQPEALGRTQEILARQLVKDLPADQVVALQPRLAALFGGLAVGFLQQAREKVLTEQEQIRKALVAERKQAEEALRKAHDELERRVEERTAELKTANEQLEREITERKQADEEIHKLSQFRESVIDNANVWLDVLDGKANVVLWNKAAEEISGYSREEVVGHGKIWEWLYPDEEYRHEITAKAAAIIERSEVVEGFETAIRCKDGQTRIISWNSQNLLDEKGNPIGSIALGRDITARKRAEEQIQVSLKEKEVLLKEIHHRVKNNLQIISSLLKLQSRYIQDKQTLEMFKESQNRVRSMALIHEKLYQSRDLAKIDFADYIRKLAAYLFRSHGVSSAAITLKINVSDISLDIDMAIPCGLIINELVSNSLKHAFPAPTGQAGRVRSERSESKGEIRIVLCSDEDNQFTLIVSDNGIGLPKDLGFGSAESLGLQLVNMLTQQLGGTIELDRSGGTAFKITFTEYA